MLYDVGQLVRDPALPSGRTRRVHPGGEVDVLTQRDRTSAQRSRLGPRVVGVDTDGGEVVSQAALHRSTGVERQGAATDGISRPLTSAAVREANASCLAVGLHDLSPLGRGTCGPA